MMIIRVCLNLCFPVDIYKALQFVAIFYEQVLMFNRPRKETR